MGNGVGNVEVADCLVAMNTYRSEITNNVTVLVDQARDARFAQNEPVVLLTNDLSAPVVDEALRLKASIIVSYRMWSFIGSW